MLLVNQLNGFGVGGGAASYQTPSYANTGGTGNRTGFITVTSGITPSSGTINNSIDGATGLNGTDSIIFPNASWVGLSILRFDWGSGVKVLITEMRMVGQTAGFNSGTFKFRASDDASSWTDYGSAVTWLSDAGPNVYTELSTNVTGYRYYELYGVTGNSNNNVWCVEWEFKIGNAI